MARFSVARWLVAWTVVTFGAVAAQGQTAEEEQSWNEIVVDVKSPGSITPAKPTLFSTGDHFVIIRIKYGTDDLAENRARLRFAAPVYDSSGKRIESDAAGHFTLPGTSHVLKFRSCKNGKHAVGNDSRDCPVIIQSGPEDVTIYSDTDSVAMFADVDTTADPKFEPKNVRSFPVGIRTARPWWKLQWSAGLAFYPGLRDEEFELVPATDDPATTQKENELYQSTRKIGKTNIPYELSAMATYMFSRRTLPLGVSFGVGTRVPVDRFSAMAGGTISFRTYPLKNSAYLTVGAAYTSHQRLRGRFRGNSQIPLDIKTTDLLETESGTGFFVALSYGFGGGQEQFTGGITKGK